MITDNVGFTSTIAPPGEWVSVEESLRRTSDVKLQTMPCGLCL